MEAGESGADTVWGIDLGTTYSCIAHLDEFDHPVVVSNEDGDPTTPSVVMFADENTVSVGKSAKQQLQMEPEHVCQLVKRHMGEPDWSFSAHGRDWSAPEIAAQILMSVADGAKSQTGKDVRRVVITVPAYFGVEQRDATKTAGEIAGLDVVEIINEPTAAAFSYGFAKGSNAEETVLVYDLGGGTFDISVIKLEMGTDGSHIRVVSTGGDHRLGGSQWDSVLVELLVSKFTEAHPEADDPMDDENSLGELKLAAESVKIALTKKDMTRQTVRSGAVVDTVSVTREEFDHATAGLLDQTIEFTRKTVEEAKDLGATEIDRVLLVGGSSFMPQVAEKLNEVFGWIPELADAHQAVAKGAAMFGANSELSSRLEDKIDSGMSEEDAEREVAQEMGLTQNTVERLKNVSITNVCSRGFGVKLLKDGGDPSNASPENFWIDHVITPNTPLPYKPDERTYGTIVDGQSAVQIELWEQSSKTCSADLVDNRRIGDGLIEIPAGSPAGTPFHVTLGMDETGLLSVVARNSIGSEIQFEVEPVNALSQEDLVEATEHASAMSRI